MFVLSPSVAATKASARSMPAASSASISRPVPTVNWPPTSSHGFSSPISSLACASGSSSRHETVCPSRSIARARDDPPRPAPTIMRNTIWTLLSGAQCEAPPSSRKRRVRLPRGRRRHQHGARRLLQHVLRDLPHFRRPRSAHAAQHRPTLHPTGGFPTHHDHLNAPPPRLVHDPRAHAPRRDHVGLDPHRLVLLPHLLRPLERGARRLHPVPRRRRIQRQRQRQLHHVDHLQPRGLPAPLLRGGPAAPRP